MSTWMEFAWASLFSHCLLNCALISDWIFEKGGSLEFRLKTGVVNEKAWFVEPAKGFLVVGALTHNNFM